jgi:hypothetical protein
MTTFYYSYELPGLAELWCRCDSCFLSGPYVQFDAYYFEDQELTFCHDNPKCLSSQEWQILSEGGWLSSRKWD